MIAKKLNYLLLLAALAAACSAASALAKAKGPTNVPVKELAEPGEAKTLMTLTRGMAAAAIGDGRLVMLNQVPGDERTLVFSPFDAGGSTRDGTFGKLTDQTRVEVIPAGETPDWRGLDVMTPRPILLEGPTMTLHELDPKTLKSVMRRTIPWDLIAPAPDRGGEATGVETAALRATFKKRFIGTMGAKATGMAQIPPAWVGSKKRAYVMALRVKGFPLVVLECELDEPSQCVLTRHCNLEGAGDLLPDAIAGIAVLPKERLVLIGDHVRHRLLGFRFDSCLHVPRARDIQLPPKMKELANFSIDGEGRLLVATRQPDDYLNASLFLWDTGW